MTNFSVFFPDKYYNLLLFVSIILVTGLSLATTIMSLYILSQYDNLSNTKKIQMLWLDAIIYFSIFAYFGIIAGLILRSWQMVFGIIFFGLVATIRKNYKIRLKVKSYLTHRWDRKDIFKKNKKVVDIFEQ